MELFVWYSYTFLASVANVTQNTILDNARKFTSYSHYRSTKTTNSFLNGLAGLSYQK
jgi:hypothetical protein